MFFFFKQKTAYEMRISDWSSDVCSSDLRQRLPVLRLVVDHHLSRRRSRHPGTRRESAGRLAARRPEPEAALMTVTPANRPLLEVDSLRVEIPGRRGTLVAVDGVSFDIGEGEEIGRAHV